MEKGIWMMAGLYVAVMAVMDVRKREIPLIPGVLCVAGVVILQFFGGKDWREWVPGMGIGLMLWCVSKLSRGGIGEGDALVYTVLGLALGFFAAMEVLTISLAMAALAGVIIMIWHRVGKHYAMPFLPFTALAYAMVVCL